MGDQNNSKGDKHYTSQMMPLKLLENRENFTMQWECMMNPISLSEEQTNGNFNVIESIIGNNN